MLATQLFIRDLSRAVLPSAIARPFAAEVFPRIFAPLLEDPPSPGEPCTCDSVAWDPAQDPLEQVTLAAMLTPAVDQFLSVLQQCTVLFLSIVVYGFLWFFVVFVAVVVLVEGFRLLHSCGACRAHTVRFQIAHV